MQDCTIPHIDSAGRPILIGNDLHLEPMCPLNSSSVLWYNRNVSLLGKLTDSVSVTEKAQCSGIRPNESDAEPLTKFGEPGMPGLDAPARPGGGSLSC